MQGGADDQVMNEGARCGLAGPAHLKDAVDVEAGGDAVIGHGDMDPFPHGDDGEGGAEKGLHPRAAGDGAAQGAGHAAGVTVEGDGVFVEGALFEDAAPALSQLMVLHPEGDSHACGEVQAGVMGDLEQIILAVESQGKILRDSRDGEGGIGEIRHGAAGGIGHLDQALLRGDGGDGPRERARCRQAGGELAPGSSAVGGEEQGSMAGDVFRDPLDVFDAAGLKALASVGRDQGEGGFFTGGADDAEEGIAEVDRNLRLRSLDLDQAGVREGFWNNPGAAAGIGLAGGDFTPGGAAIEAEIERDRPVEAGAAPGDLGGLLGCQGLPAIGCGDGHNRRGIDDVEGHPVDIHRALAEGRGDADDTLLREDIGYVPDEGARVLHIFIDKGEGAAVIQRVFEVDQGAHVEGFPGDFEGRVADDGERSIQLRGPGELEPLIGLGAVKARTRIVGEGNAVDAAVALAAANGDGVAAGGEGEGGRRCAAARLHGLLPMPAFIGGHIDNILRTIIGADKDRVSGFTLAHHARPEVVGGAGRGDVHSDRAAALAAAGVLGGEDELAVKSQTVNAGEHRLAEGGGLRLIFKQGGDEADSGPGDRGVIGVISAGVARPGDAIEGVGGLHHGDDVGGGAYGIGGIGQTGGDQIPARPAVAAAMQIDLGDDGIDRPQKIDRASPAKVTAVGIEEVEANRGSGDLPGRVGYGRIANRAVKVVGG